MATIERLHQALINADAAGDVDAAKVFAAEIRRMQADQTKASEPTPAPEKRAKLSKGYLETIGAGLGAGVGNVALGAQNLVGMGLEKLGAEQAGKWLQENAAMGKRNLAQELQPYAEANPITAGGAQLLGEVGATLPTGAALAKGASMIPNLAQAAPTLIQALRTGGFGAGAGNVGTRMAGGALTGGASAALIEPEDVGTGAAIGAALPGALGAVKGLKALAYDPLMNQEAIAGKIYSRMAGTPQMAYEAAQNIRNVQPQTQGLTLTAGQRGGNVGLSALEDAISAQQASGQLAAKTRQQNMVLANVLRKHAGSKDARESMSKAVSQASDLLYEDARKAGFDPRVLTPEAQKNIAEFQKRIPEDVLAEARKLAQINGMPLNNDTSLTGLHWVKQALDDKISKAKAQGNGRQLFAYQKLQNDLLTGLENMQPLYGTARVTHQAGMVPINRMDVAQAMADKLIPATSGDIPERLNYAALAQAMRDPDALARRSTGFEGATFDTIFNPKQAQALRGVTTDASLLAENIKRGVGAAGQSATARRLATGNILSEHLAAEAPITSKLLEVLTRTPGVGMVGKGVGMVTSFATDKIEGQILAKMDDMLANNPEKVANLITKELATMNMPMRQQVLSALPQNVLKALPATIVSAKQD